MVKIEVNVGEKLFEFQSFEDWCDTAKARFLLFNVRSKDVICVDSIGRICEKGKEFMRARDENTFPIIVYKKLI